jgi:hypothetical protein
MRRVMLVTLGSPGCARDSMAFRGGCITSAERQRGRARAWLADAGYYVRKAASAGVLARAGLAGGQPAR